MLARAYFRSLRVPGRVRIEFVDALSRLAGLEMRRRAGAVLRLDNLFRQAPNPVRESLARLYLAGEPPYLARRDRRLIRSFAGLRLGRPGRFPVRNVTGPQGRYFNLARIVDRLNRRYFSGRLRIDATWSSRPMTSLLGTWEPGRKGARNLVTINCLLDRPNVPLFYIEYLVFHEMLHDVYPQPVRHGRTQFHPPEFHAAERAFPRYAEAEAWAGARLERIFNRPERIAFRQRLIRGRAARRGRWGRTG